MNLFKLIETWIVLKMIKQARAIHQHKFGPVQSDGYQYCDQCGHAQGFGCQHKWEKEAEFTKSSCGRNTAIVTRLKCIKCGERKEHEIRA